MEQRTSMLSSLPMELKWLIVGQLDPIGLMALSQTSRDFRRAISATRLERLERLLALECLPENGGDQIIDPEIPSGASVYQDLGLIRQPHGYGIGLEWVYEGHVMEYGGAVPGWDRTSDGWRRSRWACTVCERLLPDTHFTKYYIFSEVYRKPQPGSPAASELTRWRPGRRQRTLKDVMDQPRLIRKCNECLYLQDLADRGIPDLLFRQQWLVPNFGTDRVPIYEGHRLFFDSVLDRYFPGLDSHLTTGPPRFPLRRRQNFPSGVIKELWTMYMARCPECQRWQELRAFRIGGHTSIEEPTRDAEKQQLLLSHQPDGGVRAVTIDSIVCNDCCLQRPDGDVVVLAELRCMFRMSINLLLKRLEHQMTVGWYILEGQPVQEEYYDEVKSMMDVYAEVRDVSERQDEFHGLTNDGADMLRQLHRQFLRLWAKMKEDRRFVGGGFPGNHRFETWLEHYDELDACWVWLRRVYQEVRANEDILLQWVKNRDGASLI